METKTISSDVLIIGSGGAGARAAIEVDNAGLKALIVSKGLSLKDYLSGLDVQEWLKADIMLFLKQLMKKTP